MSGLLPLNLTLLRHGRSLADDEKVHEGRYDSPLTPEGIQQAEALANYWFETQVVFEKVICSSLQRAKLTAEIIASKLNLEIEVSELWMEFDNGPLAGMKRDVALEQYPIPTFRNRFQAFTKDGGESDSSFTFRINKALEGIIQSDSQNILIVAHGGSLNKAISDLCASSKAIYAFGDTAFATLRYDRSKDSCVVTGINQIPHLEEFS